MGVKGLSSFFDQNPELSESWKLRDTRLVLDGHNLLHYLYFNENFSIVYGGAYEKYARAIRRFFTNLRKCNVYPIVILDGGTDPTGRKLPVLLDRLKDRLKKAHKISKLGETRECLLPFLCTTVFVEVLKDMAIDVLQSEFEADEEIAAIANHYQCPIVSNDSDFYLFDIVGGFVRLDSLRWETCCAEDDNDTPYISCHAYFINRFLRHFPGIDKSVLPLFGTLMGNDYVRAETFDTFFSTIRLPRHKVKNLRVSPRQIRMIGLLSWLENKTYEDVLELVVRCVKRERREFVMEVIREVAENYSQVSSVLLGYLEEPNREEPAIINPKVKSVKGNQPPAWMLRKIHNSQLSPSVLNVICNRRVTLAPMIDEPKSQSSHSCALKLRLAIYKIVLTLDGFEDCVVREYDRKNWDVGHNDIHVKYDSPLEEKIPNLIVLPNVNDVLRRSYLLDHLESENLDLSLVPLNLQIPLIALNYACKNTALPLSEEFISSVLCSLIVLGFVRTLKYKNRRFLPGLSKPEADKVDSAFSKFFNKPQHNNARVFLVDIVHRFSEYQICYRNAYNMNQLLDEPLPRPMVSESLSGNFIYNLTAVLKSRSSPDLFVSEYLGRGSRLDDVYLTLKMLIVNQLKVDRCTLQPFPVVPAPAPKKSRHKKVYSRTNAAAPTTDNDSLNRYQALGQN